MKKKYRNIEYENPSTKNNDAVKYIYKDIIHR